MDLHVAAEGLKERILGMSEGLQFGGLQYGVCFCWPRALVLALRLWAQTYSKPLPQEAEHGPTITRDLQKHNKYLRSYVFFCVWLFDWFASTTTFLELERIWKECIWSQEDCIWTDKNVSGSFRMYLASQIRSFPKN